MMRVLVTGAGGFIGHHLVNYLKDRNYWVRAVDVKLPEYEESRADDFQVADLREYQSCIDAVADIECVFHLAADMGGIGYISKYHSNVCSNNTLMNLNMLNAAVQADVQKFLFSSTACVYPLSLQKRSDITALKETDAHPAEPEEGYGWEKLYMEKLCQYYAEENDLGVRIVRLHNVYGPLGSWTGGREKAPAAICRKIALANDKESIEVWGDGDQTRSFMYVDDCVEGLHRIMNSEFGAPLNLGRDDLISLKALVQLVAKIANKKIEIAYAKDKPVGVRGRNSENSLIKRVLNWEPSIPLESGLIKTYDWIRLQVQKDRSQE